MTRFEITFNLHIRKVPDSRGMMYPIRNLHPSKRHMTSRLMFLKGYNGVDVYDEDRVTVIAEGGNLNEIEREVLDYLTKDRNIEVTNVSRRQFDVCSLADKCQTCKGERALDCDIFVQWFHSQQNASLKSHARALCKNPFGGDGL